MTQVVPKCSSNDPAKATDISPSNCLRCCCLFVSMWLQPWKAPSSNPAVFGVAGANPDPAEEQQAQSESHGTQDALLR